MLSSLPVTMLMIALFESSRLWNIFQTQLMHWALRSWKLSAAPYCPPHPLRYLCKFSLVCIFENACCFATICCVHVGLKKAGSMLLFLSQTNIPFNIIISSLCSVTFLLQITMFTISTVDFSCVFRIWDRTRPVVSNLRQKCQRQQMGRLRRAYSKARSSHNLKKKKI